MVKNTAPAGNGVVNMACLRSVWLVSHDTAKPNGMRRHCWQTHMVSSPGCLSTAT